MEPVGGPLRLTGMRTLDRRSLLRLAAGAAVASAALPTLTACGRSGVAEVALRRVSSRLVRRKVPARRAGSAAAAVDVLATTLYDGLPASGNLAYSPLSVAVALAMVTVGARGATKRQLSALLGSPGAGIDDAFNALTTHLTAEHLPGTKAHDQPAVVLADALFGQRGLTFEKPFLDVLAEDYGAGMAVVDYEDDAAGATQQIDAWVSQQTHDLIPSLIPPGVLDASTRLVLVNALYLKAAWWQPFDPPRDRLFRLADGTTASVPMVSGGVGADAVGHRGDGYRTARLDYLSHDLAMTLVVPDAGRFDEVEATLRKQGFRALLSRAGRHYAVTMPTFKVRTTAELSDLLKAAGAPLPFSDDADFGAITRDEALQIAHVIHEAVVDVDRNGTVAAASTAVVAIASSASTPPEPLVVDRPFWFVIHDTTFHTPVFVGRVTDPRG